MAFRNTPRLLEWFLVSTLSFSILVTLKVLVKKCKVLFILIRVFQLYLFLNFLLTINALFAVINNIKYIFPFLDLYSQLWLCII